MKSRFATVRPLTRLDKRHHKSALNFWCSQNQLTSGAKGNVQDLMHLCLCACLHVCGLLVDTWTISFWWLSMVTTSQLNMKVLSRCSKVVKTDVYHKQKCGSTYCITRLTLWARIWGLWGEKKAALCFKYFAQRRASSREISKNIIQSLEGTWCCFLQIK